MTPTISDRRGQNSITVRPNGASVTSRCMERCLAFDALGISSLPCGFAYLHHQHQYNKWQYRSFTQEAHNSYIDYPYSQHYTTSPIHHALGNQMRTFLRG